MNKIAITRTSNELEQGIHCSLLRFRLHLLGPLISILGARWPDWPACPQASRCINTNSGWVMSSVHHQHLQGTDPHRGYPALHVPKDATPIRFTRKTMLHRLHHLDEYPSTLFFITMGHGFSKIIHMTDFAATEHGLPRGLEWNEMDGVLRDWLFSFVRVASGLP